MKRILYLAIVVLLSTLAIQTGCSDTVTDQTQEAESEQNMPDGSVLISVLALFASGVALYKAMERKPSHHHEDNEDEYVRIKRIVERCLNDRACGSMSNGDHKFQVETMEKLSSRIANVEKQLADKAKDQSKRSGGVEEQKKSEVASPAKEVVKYAGINSGIYFFSMSDTKDGSSVYLVKLESGEAGSFEVLSFDALKSRGRWKEVVETKGCLVKDAKRIVKQDPGRCIKTSDGEWKVVKKLEITFSKD